MSTKTEQSRAAYNQIAFHYDTSMEGRYTRFHIRELADTVDPRDGDVVLDVACGNGTLLRALSKKANIQANGLDIAENMIQAAKTRCPDMNFTVGPCCPLAWRDESVDVITTCCAFHHFDQPQEFVDECMRVLKKGGKAFVADPNYGALLRLFANHIWLPLSKSGDVRVYSPRELAAFFHRAGFQDVQVYTKGKGLFLRAKKG